MKKFFQMNRKSQIILLFCILLLGLYIYSSTVLIVNILRFEGVETAIRYFLVGVTGVLSVGFIVRFRNLIKKKLKRKLLIFLTSILLLGILNLFISHNLSRIYGGISGMNKETVVYTSSMVTLMDNKDIDIENISGIMIGLLSDEASITGHVLPLEIIDDSNLDEKNEIIEYDDFIYMLNDLYDEKIDFIFLDGNYASIYNGIERYTNIANEVYTVATKEKEGEKENNAIASTKGDLTDPFTMLIMGVDSKYEGIENATAYNGDALMLLTFNPRTLNATILSIPRDTYVPVTCFLGNYENKITHAAWQGEQCMIDTIENFTGITIDYYVKVNFKGVVGIVDALGGITVDVPVEIFVGNSDREGGENTITLSPGTQLLNGEEALALARFRETIGDFERGQNQQRVIRGIINEAKALTNVEDFYNLLDTVSNNIDTNLSTNQMLSFYNVLKDILLSGSNTDEIMSLERLYLDGYSRMIWDKWFELRLYDFVYYDGSLTDVVEAMEVNLDIKKPSMMKEFSFSVNNPYEEVVIGKGKYSEPYKYATTPGFVGEDVSEAEAWATARGTEFIVVLVDDNSVANGTVLSQSIPWGKRLDEIANNEVLTVEVANNYEEIETVLEDEVPESIDESDPNVDGESDNEGTTEEVTRESDI